MTDELTRNDVWGDGEDLRNGNRISKPMDDRGQEERDPVNRIDISIYDQNGKRSATYEGQ